MMSNEQVMIKSSEARRNTWSKLHGLEFSIEHLFWKYVINKAFQHIARDNFLWNPCSMSWPIMRWKVDSRGLMFGLTRLVFAELMPRWFKNEIHQLQCVMCPRTVLYYHVDWMYHKNIHCRRWQGHWKCWFRDLAPRRIKNIKLSWLNMPSWIIDTKYHNKA